VGGCQAKGAFRNRLKINAERLFWRANLRPEHTMRLIIEARIDDGEGEAERDGITIVAAADRRDEDLAHEGLTLPEGRSLGLAASHGFARFPKVRQPLSPLPQREACSLHPLKC
jgi:hypothetical protein